MQSDSQRQASDRILRQKNDTTRSGAFSYARFGSDQLVIVTVRYLPEGCYLATSEQIPGLIVEGDSPEEVRNVARELAPTLIEQDLLSLNGALELTFINAS